MRWWRTCAGVLSAAAAFGVCAGAAGAKAVVTDKCDVEAGWAIGMNGGGQIAQTFAPSKGGALVRAKFLVRQDPGETADYVVSVNKLDREGTPTNQVLERDRIRVASLRNGPVFLDAEFSGRVELSVRKEYALVVERRNSRLTWLAAIPSPCPSLQYGNTSPGFPWPDLPGADDRDIPFTVWVER